MAGVQTGKTLRAGKALCLILVLATLAACAPKPDASLALENLSAEQIYKRGEVILEGKGKPQAALVYFQEVERLYPYSEWAKRALIMQAYSLHQAKEYEEARAAAQRFLDFYPGDEDAAYASYLLALSYYDPVSYKHLDVYKRQPQSRRTAPALWHRQPDQPHGRWPCRTRTRAPAGRPSTAASDRLRRRARAVCRPGTHRDSRFPSPSGQLSLPPVLQKGPALPGFFIENQCLVREIFCHTPLQRVS